MTEFTDKYISEADKLVDDKSEKIVLSNDAFVIGELLEQIKIQLFRGSRNG